MKSIQKKAEAFQEVNIFEMLKFIFSGRLGDTILILLIVRMGNRSSSQDAFHDMVTEIRRGENRKVSIHPEKYLALMLERLQTAKLQQDLRLMVQQTLVQKITEMELIETIASINSLKNSDFEIGPTRNASVLYDKPESKYVKINFGEGFINKIIRRLPINISLDEQQESKEKNQEKLGSPPKGRKSKEKTNQSTTGNSESTSRQKLKSIASVMKKQLHRISHPFGKLNKAFAEYIQAYSEVLFPKGNPGQEEAYEKRVRQLIIEWCNYLECSCLGPYRKWIINYTGIEQTRYTKWITNIVMQEIWAVNNGYLFSMLATVIYQKKVPLNIDIQQIQYSAAQLTPTLFNIDSKLQIEGHFFDSIYEMSEIVSKARPEQILAQLETVKKRICTDIDNYHRLIELGQVYEIDSDNILGIVAYILCKIASRIEEIYVHLIFLRIVYGQNVYFSMGVGSYMLSTIFGALQFLESNQFRELIDCSRLSGQGCKEDDRSGPNYSETKETVSQKDYEQKQLQNNQSENESILVSSLVLRKQQSDNI